MDDELDSIIDLLNRDQPTNFNSKFSVQSQNQPKPQHFQQESNQILMNNNSSKSYQEQEKQHREEMEEEKKEQHSNTPKANQYSSNNKSQLKDQSATKQESQMIQQQDAVNNDQNSHLLQQLPAVQSTQFKKYLCFRPYIDPISIKPYKPPDRGYYFKLYNNVEAKLIRYLLEDNGFREATKREQEFTIIWASSSIKSQTYQSLTRYQKINHFPKSTEITRKDCMYRLLARMREFHGPKHYGFVPLTFILPNELGELQKAMEENPSLQWIVKPSASSQGKGIFLTNNVNDIPPKQSMIASQYIANPMLIDDYKFDLRIYVGITSINPLRVYIYDEGLTRFATVKYNQSTKKQSRYVHLTNYSLNKFNANFINNTDAEVDDQGSKWSVSALRRRMAQLGIDHDQIFKKIEDIIIKTIISGENVINNATEMFVPFSNNCFELLGFDVLIDDTFEPWLLEVNLSPSLNCDSPLDQKIKANLISDLFNLAGMIQLDERNASDQVNSKKVYSAYSAGNQNMSGTVTDAYSSQLKNAKKSKPGKTTYFSAKNPQDMTKEERMILKETEDEFKRKGAFKRVFPSMDFPYYKQFFEEDRPWNYFLDVQLFNKVRLQNPQQKKIDEKIPRFLQQQNIPLAQKAQISRMNSQNQVLQESTSFNRKNSLSAHSHERPNKLMGTRNKEESSNNTVYKANDQLQKLKSTNSLGRSQNPNQGGQGGSVNHSMSSIEMPNIKNANNACVPQQKNQFKAPLPTGKRGRSTARGAGLRQIGSIISQNTPSGIYHAALSEIKNNTMGSGKIPKQI